MVWSLLSRWRTFTSTLSCSPSRMASSRRRWSQSEMRSTSTSSGRSINCTRSLSDSYSHSATLQTSLSLNLLTTSQHNLTFSSSRYVCVCVSLRVFFPSFPTYFQQEMLLVHHSPPVAVAFRLMSSFIHFHTEHSLRGHHPMMLIALTRQSKQTQSNSLCSF